MKNKKMLYSIIGIIIVLLVFLFIFFLNSFNKKRNYLLVNIDSIESNDKSVPTYYEDVINDVKKEYNNDDIKGILEIENTDYVVPILQHSDNDYYLNHDAYGNSNYMGAIYLDFRVDIDSSRKILIFGHNSSNVDMPFKILEEFYDKDYYDNHKFVSIITSQTKKRYEVFSVFVEVEDFSYMNLNFNSDEEYLNHLKKLKSKSMYDTGVEVTKDDEVLILQTCSTHPDYRNYQKKYLLIILRRV